MAEANNKKDSLLFNAFEKLKVKTDWGDPKWSEVPTSLEGPCSFASKKDDEKHTTLKSPVKSFCQRANPYPKDKLHCHHELPTFDQLSFGKEDCTRRGCKCRKRTNTDKSENSNPKNHLFLTVRCDGSDSTLDASTDAAPVLSSPKRILKEARLKLHNKHKDHKVVLRAARLRLANGTNTEKKTQMGASCTFNTAHSPKLGNKIAENSVLFGSTQTNSSQKDFHTLYKKSKPCKSFSAAAASESNKDKFFFQGSFRTPDVPGVSGQCNDRAFDLDSLKQTLDTEADESTSGAVGPGLSRTDSGSSIGAQKCPLHPGKCTRPCSCAHQARLDDWSEEELACYFEEFVHIPKKMSMMAEMMYT